MHDFKVAVEGNIGSGKTTFLQYFKRAETVEVIIYSLQTIFFRCFESCYCI